MEIKFPNKLKMYRRCCGYSQKKVARMLRLRDTSALSRWEHGIAVPGLLQIFLLAQIYNTHPHDLFDDIWREAGIEYNLLTHSDEPFTNNHHFSV